MFGDSDTWTAVAAHGKGPLSMSSILGEETEEGWHTYHACAPPRFLSWSLTKVSD
ncbi:MAG: hypothetical protein PHU51_04210 [Candidatus Nanoarchaeia archaeon]|nr:hypothetical protein [Candidatus Nanoarchaeia archaeon]